MHPKFGPWPVAAACALFPAVTCAAPVDDVKALLDRGQAAAACVEARKHPQLMGDPAFDFHYGAACIEGGRPGEGVLALERYLLVHPDNLSARLNVARGYFLLGDDAHATAELTEIRKLPAPPEVLAAVDRYLDALRTRRARGGFGSGFYLEAGGGHDSNVNAGPTASEVLLPGFGLLPLDAGSRQISDPFLSLGGGGYVSYAARPGVTLFASAQGERRWHDEERASSFDLETANAAAGVSLLGGRHLVRASLLYGYLGVGEARYRTTEGGSVEWQYQLSGGRSLTAGLVAARLSHGLGNEPRDANLYAGSVGVRQQFASPWNPVLTASLSAGEQRSRTGFDELVPRMLGANVAMSYTPAPKFGVQVGYTYQRSRYQGPDFFAYPEHRLDHYHALNAAFSWLLGPNLSLRLEALASRNRSNAAVYEFPREVIALKLRFDSK